MKLAAFLAAGLAITACKEAEQTANDTAGTLAGDDAPDAGGADVSSDDDEPSGGANGSDDDARPEPVMEPEAIDFGGDGVEVVVEVEPTDEPTPPDQPAEPEPVETPAEPPLVSCEGVSGTGDGVLIDDLEDTDLETLWQDERSGSWFWYDDESGGTHSLIIDPTSDGAPGSSYAVHVVGGGFTEWGSGLGFGLRWDGPSGERCVYDASYYTGVRFWMLGNGTPVRLIATNPTIIPLSEGGECEDECWDNHGFDLESPVEWTEVFVSFAELGQRWTDPPLAFDATRIFTIEFTLDAGAEYDLWIDDIGFYREGEELPAYGAE